MLAGAQAQGRIRQGAVHLRLSAAMPAELSLSAGHEACEELCIPLVPQGFAWRLEDFQSLHPVGDYATKLLTRTYRTSGWGTPVVVQRSQPTHAYREEAFLRRGVTFAATALLQWDNGLPRLDLYNPHRQSSLRLPVGEVRLAADFTAPFAFRPATNPDRPSPIADYIFVEDSPQDEGLFLLEPYQPGKVPLLLVHGLMSNPETWIDMANDLLVLPGFADCFQIWGFRYDTGRPFLGSAARLRSDLDTLMQSIDQGHDPALHRLVLAGHSMGGLICKLQVVNSEDVLWRAAANRPFDQINTDDPTRVKLAELFFFEANRRIERVVFIATPHRGSSWASRPIGRVASRLVRRTPTERQWHAELIANNPGVFSKELRGRFPTSVDMLSPRSPLLQSIDGLRVSPCVRVHSVLGTGGCSLHRPSDGVVTVASAVSPEAASQVAIDSRHTRIHRELKTTEELVRILQQHLARR